MSNAEKARQVLRGLERRERQAPPPRIPHREKSTPTLAEDATAGGRKKRPGQSNSIAAAWAENAPPYKPHRRVAEEVISAAGTLAPRQLNQLVVDGILAGWRNSYATTTLYTRAGILRKLLHALRDIRFQRTSISSPPEVGEIIRLFFALTLC